MRILPLLLLVAVCLSHGARAEAGGTVGANDEPGVLRVGIHEVPPFAMSSTDGQWHGLGVVLWEEIAKKNGWQFAYEPMPFEDLVPALGEGRIDVVLGMLLVNPTDEAAIDFSQPFLNTTIGVAVSKNRWNPSWLQILIFAFDWTFLQLFLGVLPILVVVSLLVWHFERRRNAKQFGGRVPHALGSAFWFTTVTMTSTGYGDKTPVTFGGRVVTIVWMFVSLILITGFTASVASTVATVRTGSEISSPADLMRFKNAVLHGGQAQQMLSEISAPIEVFEDIDAAIGAVEEGAADTVVADSLVLSYLIHHKFPESILLLDLALAHSRVAMALPAGSDLREPLNVALLAAVRSPEWQVALRKYINQEQNHFP